MAYKNLTSQEEAWIVESLDNAGVGRYDFQIHKNFFTELGNKIVKEFREVVEKETGDTSGHLKSTIVPIPSPKGFDIEGAFYFKFIDDGVNAAPRVGGLSYEKNRVTGAPFGFKNLGVGSNFAKSIRESYGYSMSDAYGVAKGIKKYGIKPKNITEKVITDNFLEKVSEDIATILGLAVEVTFDKATE